MLITDTPNINLLDTFPLWEYYFTHKLLGDENDKTYKWANVESTLYSYYKKPNTSYSSFKPLLDRLIEEFPPETEDDWTNLLSIYYLFETIRAEEGNYSEALNAIDDALSLEPDHFTVEHLKIDQSNLQSKLAPSNSNEPSDLSAQNFSELLDEAVKENDWAAIINIEETHVDLNSADAEENSSSTPSHQPTSGLIHGNLLSVAEKNRYQSIDEYLDALETAFNSDDMELMVDLTEEAIELYPDNDRFWSIKGAGLNNLERYDEAIEAADKAISLDRSNAHAWFVKGYALEKQGKYNDAEIYYEKSLELDPNDEDYLEGLERLRGLMQSS